nr:SusC/RagA family TonB-linked outer membrane protein [uncultured Allomuricauda sp.]
MCKNERQGDAYALNQITKKLCSLLVLVVFPFCVTAMPQNAISLTVNNEPVAKVLKKISRKADVSIVFKETFFEDEERVSFSVENVPYVEVLKLCMQNTGYTYRIEDKLVLIVKDDKKPSVPQQNIIVQGMVVDVAGVPLPFVTVYDSESKVGTETDENGAYELFTVVGHTISFTTLGFVDREVRVTGENNKIDVVLEEEVEDLDEVVVTGIVKRKRETFTGSTISISGEKLQEVGTRNVLASIKNIDPSFRIEENLEIGSDPNRFPDINIRGKSALPDLTGSFSGNPNQPLFILDGFETTVDRIYDLDMTRVKSITLLKDASAKAIYGSKAGNGVVVVETVEPELGKLRINYSSTLTIEAPDLTGYNLMDAKEKLAWENEQGMYVGGNPYEQNYKQQVYNNYYQDVYLKGVDTYWLSKPLETGIGQRHSISLDGGDEAVRYGASFFYNDISGAMKESGRKTFTGNANLSYRIKNMMFRNILEFSQNKASNSPYGSFGKYVSLNPYFQPYMDNGLPNTVAGFFPYGTNGQDVSYNPLYNASLGIIDEDKYLRVNDNFYAEWTPLRGFRLTGTFGYTYQKNDGDRFLPPNHTDFIDYTEQNSLIEYKGKWTRSEGFYKSLQSNIGANYNFGTEKHRFFANATLNLSDIQSQTNTYVGEGFGTNRANDISLANYYQRSSSPQGSDRHDRSIGIIGILNYSLNEQFLLDVSYRTSASSIYGEDNRWGQFWSFGFGYNLHNEKSIKDLNIFQTLKLRSSMGYTGSQNAASYNSIATYDYSDITYSGQQGAILLGMPNPDLAWQKVRDYNLGIDMALIDNKFSFRFDIYEKTTENLLQSIDGAPSIGFSSYIANIGNTKNKGIEFAVGYEVFRNVQKKAYLNVLLTGTHIKNKLTKLSDAFTSYNDRIDEYNSDSSSPPLYTRPVARFYEGQSLDAIWVMPSLGIDPATGQEIFLDSNGDLTYTWSAQDLVVMGDAQPDLNGTLGINAGYRGFTLSANATYRVGAQLYNSTLVNRVENIDGRSNLDRRIYDAWSQPGDVAIYKKPEVSSSASRTRTTTRPTSRFVQENNEFYISSLNLGYEVQNKSFLGKLGLSRLRFMATANDLLRVSSIEIERGTSYPFTRNFTFTLNAAF